MWHKIVLPHLIEHYWFSIGMPIFQDIKCIDILKVGSNRLLQICDYLCCTFGSWNLLYSTNLLRLGHNLSVLDMRFIMVIHSALLIQTAFLDLSWPDIADVTNFVHPGTPLDEEAAQRGTSVYLVGQRIDMLPKPLTEGADASYVACIWIIELTKIWN
jgi:hypothetical protein